MNSLRSLSHRARTKRVFSGIALASVLILFGCPNPTSPPPPAPLSPEAVLRDARAKVAQNPSAFYVADGALKSNILLISHGGPLFELLKLDQININSNTNYTRVLVKQEQMIRQANNALPTNRTITAEESRQINLYSAAIIYALGEHFQRQGRTVSLYTRSWGSFVAAEMYRRWNDKPFKKILIAVGRLDMPQEIVANRRAVTEPQKTFGSDGVSIVQELKSIEQQERETASQPGLCTSTDPQKQFFARFYCTDGTLDQAKIQKQIFLMQSMFFLAHDLLQHRYTQLLDSKALGKAIFYFGGRDRNTGRPNAKEIQFLTGRTGTISAASGFTKETVSVDATRNVGGVPTSVTENREVYTMNGQNGHATVKYGAQDAHSMKSLLPDLQSDILASFATR